MTFQFGSNIILLKTMRYHQTKRYFCVC